VVLDKEAALIIINMLVEQRERARQQQEGEEEGRGCECATAAWPPSQTSL
jgi:hypothetical protein